MRYYYKAKDGKSFYNFKSESADESLIQITEDEFNELTKQKEPSKEDKAKKEAFEKIAELKSLLSSTDYQAIKYAEGELSEEEYAETKAKRKEWRSQINELEKSI